MSNLVLTPGGYKPQDLVHHVPPETMVRMRDDIADIVHRDGRVMQSIGQIVARTADFPLMPNNVSRLLPDRTLLPVRLRPNVVPAGGASPGLIRPKEPLAGKRRIPGFRDFAEPIQHGLATAAHDVAALVESAFHGLHLDSTTFHRDHGALQGAQVHETIGQGRIIPFASIDGWVVYGGWTNTSGQPISRLASSWMVPPEPVNKGAQTIFLFNGIQNSTMIYQPVLQWGPSAAGGGPRWSVASWYADGQTGVSFFSNVVDVQVGQLLTGVMTLTGQSNGKFDYNCEFSGIANTSLPISQVEELTWANETLEVYGVSACEDYPNTSKTRFSNIVLQTGMVTPGLAWTDNENRTDCGAHAVIVDNSATSGIVDLWYRGEYGEGGWDARHGMTSGEYQAKFDDLTGNQDMQLVCVSGYDDGGEARYAAIWRKVAAHPGWTARHGLNSAEHQQLFTDLPAQGFFPVLVNGYTVGGDDLFASIWHQGNAPEWAARHGLTSDGYQQAFDDLVGQGFFPVWVSGYGSGDARFAAVFHKPVAVPQMVARHNLTNGDYQGVFNDLTSQGFRPRCVSGYGTSGGDRYAAIFDKPASAPGMQARHGLDAAQYQQLFTDLPPQNLHPIGVNGYNVGGNVRFTALWEG